MSSSAIISVGTHVLGSWSGYKTLRASADIAAQDITALEILGFGQTNDEAFLSSLDQVPAAFGRPLPSGRYGVTRCFLGSPDSAGRTTLLFATLVFDRQDWVSHASGGLPSLLSASGTWAFRHSAEASTEQIRLSSSPVPISLRDPIIAVIAAWQQAALSGAIAVAPDEETWRAAITQAPCVLPPAFRSTLRWGVRVLSVGAPTDLCTIPPAGSQSGRRRVVRTPGAPMPPNSTASLLQAAWAAGRPFPEAWWDLVASTSPSAPSRVAKPAAPGQKTSPSSRALIPTIVGGFAIALLAVGVYFVARQSAPMSGVTDQVPALNGRSEDGDTSSTVAPPPPAGKVEDTATSRARITNPPQIPATSIPGPDSSWTRRQLENWIREGSAPLQANRRSELKQWLQQVDRWYGGKPTTTASGDKPMDALPLREWIRHGERIAADARVAGLDRVLQEEVNAHLVRAKEVQLQIDAWVDSEFALIRQQWRELNREAYVTVRSLSETVAAWKAIVPHSLFASKFSDECQASSDGRSLPSFGVAADASQAPDRKKDTPASWQPLDGRVGFLLFARRSLDRGRDLVHGLRIARVLRLQMSPRPKGPPGPAQPLAEDAISKALTEIKEVSASEAEFELVLEGLSRWTELLNGDEAVAATTPARKTVIAELRREVVRVARALLDRLETGLKGLHKQLAETSLNPKDQSARLSNIRSSLQTATNRLDRLRPLCTAGTVASEQAARLAADLKTFDQRLAAKEKESP